MTNNRLIRSLHELITHQVNGELRHLLDVAGVEYVDDVFTPPSLREALLVALKAAWSGGYEVGLEDAFSADTAKSVSLGRPDQLLTA